MPADPRTLPTRRGYPTFSAAEIGRRHGLVRQALRSDDLSCLVLYGAGLLHGANQSPPILKTRATAHSNPAGDFAFRDGMVVTLQP